MRNLKIIRGFGMAFLVGAVLTSKMITTVPTNVALAIVSSIAAVIIVPTQMISIDKEYEEEKKKRLNRRQA
ncbi:hypothetical protein [Enterococcus pallens]|uniref:Uncharacterized protein n=1 Tax=Enterococcus pallens ATCC BAA-351 TaxID=1158607 RepID=R2SEW8_9ENTE|nr:hypothetical protein [Enterococcus pallens]EOH86734.1 hypothetical protein UAU_05180 [Enterococcus pallens ATCC BAA-351]EOU18530.1 hypothetical protein I588_03525 [Enterococcus pallens ATCC BAA-351]